MGSVGRLSETSAQSTSGGLRPRSERARDVSLHGRRPQPGGGVSGVHIWRPRRAHTPTAGHRRSARGGTPAARSALDGAAIRERRGQRVSLPALITAFSFRTREGLARRSPTLNWQPIGNDARVCWATAARLALNHVTALSVRGRLQGGRPRGSCGPVDWSSRYAPSRPPPGYYHTRVEGRMGRGNRPTAWRLLIAIPETPAVPARHKGQKCVVPPLCRFC